jgi:hypothetical protein
VLFHSFVYIIVVVYIQEYCEEIRTNYRSKDEQAKDNGFAGGADERGRRVEGRGRIPGGVRHCGDVPPGIPLRGVPGEVLREAEVQRLPVEQLIAAVRALHALSPRLHSDYCTNDT